MPTRALSGARMVRDLGVTNEFLAPNVASSNKIQQVASDRFLARDIRTSGTGNISPVQPWYDVQVPDWTTGAHITNWSTLQYYLSAVAETNSLIPVSAGYVELVGTGTWPGALSYTSGILAPNGKIYCPPYQTSLGRIIDPNNSTVTTFGAGSFPAHTSGFYGHTGGGLAPNGRIYCPGSWGTTVLKVIDPSNNTVANIHTQTAGGAGFNYPVLAPNDKMYCFPNPTSHGFTGVTYVMVIDPSTNTISSIGPVPGAPAIQQSNFVVHPNGKIYTTPNSSTSGSTYAIILDPANNTFTTYVPSAALGGKFNFSPSGTGQFSVPVVAFNGKIFFTPYNASVICVIDPSLSTSDNNFVRTLAFPYSSLTTSNTLWPYQDACIAPNGKIYYIPGYATVMGVVDPDTETFSTLPITAPTGLWGNANFGNPIVTPNGKIFSVPYYATSAFALNLVLNNNHNINVCTNPFFNKP